MSTMSRSCSRAALAAHHDDDGFGVTGKLEAHTDRNLRHEPRVLRQARVAGLRARVGHLRRPGEGVAAEERRGVHHASGYGNFAPTPPSTTNVWPVTYDD